MEIYTKNEAYWGALSKKGRKGNRLYGMVSLLLWILVGNLGLWAQDGYICFEGLQDLIMNEGFPNEAAD